MADTLIFIPVHSAAAAEGLSDMLEEFQRALGRFWWVSWISLGATGVYIGLVLARWTLLYGDQGSIWWPQSGGDWVISSVSILVGCLFGPIALVTVILLVLTVVGASWLIG